MRILIAMCSLQFRSGAELFVRDIALSLHQRGHSVTVYAPIMGDMADELRAVCVACVTELSRIAHAPDVILGNTRDDTVACMAKFLGVPVISVCHDRTASHGQPPMFTRVRQYIAVDENCAERFYLENGIPRSAVAIVSNGVDVHRFLPREPIPAKPSRAAIFSNYATEHQDTATIRTACAALGIPLEVIGAGVGRQAASPEQILGQYDLVFAKARCAMEAMAVGCAVILYNEGMGLAGMVTTENVCHWHRWNFGRRLLQAPLEHEALIQAILRYNAADAQAVSSYVRDHVSLAATTQLIERIAQRVLDEEPTRATVSPQQELREFARHTADNLLPFGTTQMAVQVGLLSERLQQLEATVARQRRQLESSRHGHPLAQILEQKSHELNHATSQLKTLEQHNHALLHSLSWRITAPLRWLGRKLGI